MKVVPQSSACIPGFESVPLPVDHLKMAKYDGPHNPCYKKLLPVIQRMVLAAPEKGQARWNNRDFVQDNSKIAAVNLECQKALFVSWPDTELKGIKRRLGERTPDTCEWLTIKGDFINWQRGDRYVQKLSTYACCKRAFQNFATSRQFNAALDPLAGFFNRL